MSVCEQKEARSEETNVHCECYGTICEMLLKHMLHAKNKKPSEYGAQLNYMQIVSTAIETKQPTELQYQNYSSSAEC